MHHRGRRCSMGYEVHPLLECLGGMGPHLLECCLSRHGAALEGGAAALAEPAHPPTARPTATLETRGEAHGGVCKACCFILPSAVAVVSLRGPSCAGASHSKCVLQCVCCSVRDAGLTCDCRDVRARC